jgi:DNA invertase Pin-like site-specific DNA recombinase
MKPEPTIFPPKTRKQIAEEYGISRKTLYRWLNKAGIVLAPGLVKHEDLKRIYEVLGPPPLRKPA